MNIEDNYCTMTYEEFVVCIEQIQMISSKINDNWELVRDNPEIVFIKRRSSSELLIVKNKFHEIFILSEWEMNNYSDNRMENEEKETAANYCSDEIIEQIDEGYDAALATVETKNLKILSKCHIEHQVLYHISYQTPMLCINLLREDGSITSYVESINLFEYSYVEGKIEKNFAGNMITQMDHPVYFTPILTVHPCKTENLLKQLPKSFNRVITFLTAIGPKFRLNLHILYGKPYSDDVRNT